MNSGRERALLVLAVLAGLAFGYPVLAVIDALTVCCLPGLVPLYLFLSWAVVIGLAAALVVRRRERGP